MASQSGWEVWPVRSTPSVIEVTLQTGEIAFQSTVYFAKYPDLPRNLLGRQGWLWNLKLGVIDYDNLLYLGAYGAHSQTKLQNLNTARARRLSFEGRVGAPSKRPTIAIGSGSQTLRGK